MRKLTLTAVMLASLTLMGAAVHARTGDAGRTHLAGVAWENSPASAREKARREGRPVLLLQLFGRLDEEFC